MPSPSVRVIEIDQPFPPRRGPGSASLAADTSFPQLPGFHIRPDAPFPPPSCPFFFLGFLHRPPPRTKVNRTKFFLFPTDVNLFRVKLSSFFLFFQKPPFSFLLVSQSPPCSSFSNHLHPWFEEMKESFHSHVFCLC